MNVRWPLSRKILCLALLNLVLLAAAFLAFARSQFQLGAESLLLGPAHDRIVGIASAFSMDLETTPAAGRDDLLASYSRRYSAEFLLASPQGNRIAGPEIGLSPPVLDQMRRVVPPPGGRRPPGPGAGPPEGDDPPEGRRGPPRDPPAGIDPPEGAPPRPQLPRESVFLVITHDPTTYWAGARIPVSIAGESGARPGILLLRTGSIFNSKLFFDWRWWLGAPFTVIAVSVLCWLPFIRGLTRSIARMDRVTAQIAQGRFDIQVGNCRSDELGHLGEQIDRMSVRLQSFVKNQKRFLGDIAHELCAPIARIQFALGILEERAGEERRADVAVLHEEIQEMSGLVNELLSFSKAGLHADAAALSPVGIAAVAQRAVAREAFAAGSVEIAIDSDLAALANENLLLRAVSNIVRNAIRYAGESGPIAITAGRQGEQVWITVADCGPGLPEAELEEVFAPFYRPESARTRETGGVGLGLAIVRTCVEACRGTVACRNRKPAGLEVTIRLASSKLEQ